MTGGAVTEAAPVDGRDDLWRFTVTPSGTGNVSILLQGGRAFTEAGAICTGTGGPLAAGFARIVP